MKITITKIFLVCISLMITGLIIIGQSYAKLDLGTVAGIWLFDEGKGDTAKDSSGNGNNGEMFGGVKRMAMMELSRARSGSRGKLVQPLVSMGQATEWSFLTLTAWIYKKHGRLPPGCLLISRKMVTDTLSENETMDSVSQIMLSGRITLVQVGRVTLAAVDGKVPGVKEW